MDYDTLEEEILEHRAGYAARVKQRSKNGKLEELSRADQPKSDMPKEDLPQDIAKDFPSLLLLLLLYTLQGVPIGLSASVPFILQSKVSYKEQGVFSLVSWPFSLKLLWAPIVDSVYSRKVGRRKSWLIPVQTLIGAIMIFSADYIPRLLGDEPWNENDELKPQVGILTALFLGLFFMTATQDIAVDGWALTMLSRENVALASTCNGVGQTLGYFVAYVGFLTLHDPNICNEYLRSDISDEGIVTLGGFMWFWGWVFIITTVWVTFMKKEEPEEEEDSLSIKEAYLQMLKVLRLPSVHCLMAVMLTSQIGFATADAVTSLKLVEYGVPTEKLALMAPLLIPIGIVLPVFVGRMVTGPRPLSYFMHGYLPRLLVGLLYAAIVWFTPRVVEDGRLPFFYYVTIFVSAVLHEITSTFQFVAKMAFFATISDPQIGGTYMTLLNTITNFGVKWPNSASLFLVDSLTYKSCYDEGGSVLGECDTADGLKSCDFAEGVCRTRVDGYYIQIAICTTLGLAWIISMRPLVRKVQDFSLEQWHVSKKGKSS